MASFTPIVSNDLEEVRMIAGDNKTFTYNIYDINGGALDLTGATCSVSIFKHGEPYTLLLSISGSITAPAYGGQFTAKFLGSDNINFSGVYQQQVRIVDSNGLVHIPSQGKIIIFPAITTSSSTVNLSGTIT